jgi:hypothetical protein
LFDICIILFLKGLAGHKPFRRNTEMAGIDPGMIEDIKQAFHVMEF